MNKQEAAEFLGVSVRALERYVQLSSDWRPVREGKDQADACL
jgi:hypothetical protein